MIFIDTDAFTARYVERDQHHSTALKAWRRLPKLGRRHYTSNFVLDETVTLLGRWSDHVFAADRARHLYASRALEILRPSQDDEIVENSGSHESSRSIVTSGSRASRHGPSIEQATLTGTSKI